MRQSSCPSMSESCEYFVLPDQEDKKKKSEREETD